MAGMSCVLCAIAAGAMHATVFHKADDILAIAPLRSAARVHILLFPTEHFADLPALLNSQPARAAATMKVAQDLAGQHGLTSTGYRLVWNYGPDTHQRLCHPHLHLLGGQDLQGVTP